MPQPNKIPKAFAASGDRNTIPESTGTLGLASWNEGFPAITSVPFAEGGLAPKRADFNGIFNALSAATVWNQQGGVYTYDNTTDYEVGNLAFSDGTIYQCITANGPSSSVKNPKNNVSFWLPVVTLYSQNLTWTVGSGGDFTTLAAALNAAKAWRPVGGTYTITLQIKSGTSVAGATVEDADLRHVRVTSADATVPLTSSIVFRGSQVPQFNLTFTRATAANFIAVNCQRSFGNLGELNVSGGAASAFYIVMHSDLLIKGNVSDVNGYAYEIGYGSNAMVDTATITNCTVGVRVYQAGRATVKDCTISNMTNHGILAMDASFVQARNNTITYCIENGIYSYNASSVLAGYNTIKNCGAGVYARWGGRIALSNDILADNTSAFLADAAGYINSQSNSHGYVSVARGSLIQLTYSDSDTTYNQAINTLTTAGLILSV